MASLQARTIFCPLSRVVDHLYHYDIQPEDLFGTDGFIVEMAVIEGEKGEHHTSISFTRERGGVVAGSILDIHADRLRGKRGAVIHGGRITSKDLGGVNISELRAAPFGGPSTTQFASVISATVACLEAMLADRKVRGVDFHCPPSKVGERAMGPLTLLFRGGKRITTENIGLETISTSDSAFDDMDPRTIYAGRPALSRCSAKILAVNPVTGKIEGEIQCGAEITLVKSIAIDRESGGGFYAIVQTNEMTFLVYDGNYMTGNFGLVVSKDIPLMPDKIFDIGNRRVLIQYVEGAISIHSSMTWKPIQEAGIPDIDGARIAKVFPDRSGKMVIVTERNPLTGAVGIWLTKLRRAA